MKTKIFYALLTAAFLYSCGGNSNENDSKTTTDQDSTVVNDTVSVVTDSNTILVENKISHAFSNAEKKDEFYVCIKGKSFVDGMVNFKVTNFEGVEIYSDVFTTELLIEGMDTLVEKEVNIKKRIAEFFSEIEFSKPAVKSTDKFLSHYPDKALWKEIKADASAIGFHYKICEGMDKTVVFSKKTNKVLQYK